MWVVKMYVLILIPFRVTKIFFFVFQVFFSFFRLSATFNDDLHLRLIFLQLTRFYLYFPYLELIFFKFFLFSDYITF